MGARGQAPQKRFFFIEPRLVRGGERERMGGRRGRKGRKGDKEGQGRKGEGRVKEEGKE